MKKINKKGDVPEWLVHFGYYLLLLIVVLIIIASLMGNNGLFGSLFSNLMDKVRFG